MKKKIKILSNLGLTVLLFSGVFLVFSGNKNSTFSRKASGENLITAFYNRAASESEDILLINDVVQTKYGNSVSTISLQGNLSEINEGKVDVNEISTTIAKGTFYWSTANDQDSTDTVEAYFGAENTFTVNGEVINGFYIPQPLRLEFENGSDFEFNREEGINFRWNSDERNEYPLIVVLQNDAENDEQLITKQFSFNERDRSATISPDELLEFPSDSKLTLYAGRGNGKIVSIQNKEVSLAGFSITSLPGIVLR